MEKKKNNLLLYILLVIIGILIGIGIGYGIYKVNNKENLKDNPVNENNNEREEIDNNTKGIEIYYETTSGEYENIISKMTVNGIDVLNYIEEKNVFADSVIEYKSNSKIAVINIEEYSTGYINHCNF